MSKIRIRDYFKNEATDFTPWLSKTENLNDLAKAINLSENLIFDKSEVWTGDFRLDILAHTENSNKTVIIENMFGSSDHDHLGKSVTYAAWHNASIVIWVVENARIEHRNAIGFLNLKTNVQFYLVEMQPIENDNQFVRVQYTLTKAPSNDEIQEYNYVDPSEKERLYRRYWMAFSEFCDGRYKFSIPEKGQPWIHINTGGGNAWHMELKVTKESIWVQFYGKKEVLTFIKTEWVMDETIGVLAKISCVEECDKWNNYEDTIDDDKIDVTISYTIKANWKDEIDWERQFAWYVEMLNYMIPQGEYFYQAYKEEV